MSEQKCPICGDGTLARRAIDFKFVIENARGEKRELSVPGVVADVCSKCGEEFLDASSEDRIAAAHRNALGLLTAEEIRNLRGKRTQAEMCELLGIGEKTYSRWESGSHFQSEAFDRLLRMLIMVSANLELLELIASAKREERVDRLMPKKQQFMHLSKDLETTEQRFNEAIASGRVLVMYR